MKTLQHVGHVSTKWTLNGVELKDEGVKKYDKKENFGEDNGIAGIYNDIK